MRLYMLLCQYYWWTWRWRTRYSDFIIIIFHFFKGNINTKISKLLRKDISYWCQINYYIYVYVRTIICFTNTHNHVALLARANDSFNTPKIRKTIITMFMQTITLAARATKFEKKTVYNLEYLQNIVTTFEFSIREAHDVMCRSTCVHSLVVHNVLVFIRFGYIMYWWWLDIERLI